eukprot:g29052.t1
MTNEMDAASRLFGVKHFAGQVFYEASDFVRKNASAHRPDISAFLRAHGGTFVREMISDDKDAALPRRGRKLFGRTLINIFQQELNELCSTLEARDCTFLSFETESYAPHREKNGVVRLAHSMPAAQ